MAPHPGKQLVIAIGGVPYARYPVRTHVVLSGEDIVTTLSPYLAPHLASGDTVFVSEKIVAIAEGRAYPIREIRPSALARFLVRFVYRSPHGIGLASPWTMELALREAGVPRILLASVASALTKPFGIRGVFYRIAGRSVASIDGPTLYTLPPYNEYAKLGPKDSSGFARRLSGRIGCEVVVIDANDLGVEVLGKSSGAISDSFARAVFRDNPLGQGSEQTPLCIVRRTYRP